MTLGELAPYVVQTDHDGVELDLPGVPPEIVQYLCGMLAFGMLGAAIKDSENFLGWLAFAGVLLICVVAWPQVGTAVHLRLRLEQRRLVLHYDQDRIVSTVDLLRVEIAGHSLLLWHLDGTVDTVDLPVKNLSLLADLARILEQNLARHDGTSPIPESLRRLRERNPQ